MKWCFFNTKNIIILVRVLLLGGGMKPKTSSTTYYIYIYLCCFFPSKDVASGLSTLFATACSIAVLHCVLLSLRPHPGRPRAKIKNSSSCMLFDWLFPINSIQSVKYIYIYIHTHSYVQHFECCSCFQLGMSIAYIKVSLDFFFKGCPYSRFLLVELSNVCQYKSMKHPYHPVDAIVASEG